MGDIYGRSKSNLKIVWKVGVIIVGVILVILGIYNIANDSGSGKNKGEVMSTVTRVEKTVLNGQTKTLIYVQYNVDGTQYTSTLDDYTEEVKDKQVIKVYYNKSNPTEITSNKDGNMLGYVLILIGLVILVVWFLLNNLLFVNTDNLILK